ncbi:MAG: hypothetical protein H0Z32_05070 [Bacillaceae bacterium]|nr:hypothetical protein [Bacillaceae bacterium]
MLKEIWFIILFLFLTACYQTNEISTVDKNANNMKNMDSSSSLRNDTTQKIFDWREAVHTFTIENFNSKGHDTLSISLPDEWGAITTQYEGAYTIVNEQGERIGEWSIVGQSPDQPDGFLPNHIESEEKEAIQTKLGKGHIYQLELSLSDPETNESSSLYMVYVLIPIANMDQSYNFFIEFPSRQAAKHYMEVIKDLLQ